nr:hypothetical protein [Tanacetum cinerariifolium]
MAGVDINTLTIEQYLALSRKNQTPGVVKPEIRGNVSLVYPIILAIPNPLKVMNVEKPGRGVCTCYHLRSSKRLNYYVKGTGGNSGVSKKPTAKKCFLVVKPLTSSALRSAIAAGVCRSSSPSLPGSRHILGIVTAPVICRDPQQDMFYVSMSMDFLRLWPKELEHSEQIREKLERRVERRDATIAKREAKIAWLKKLMEEKPFREVARLRLGNKEVDREIARKAQVGYRNASLRGQVDGETKVNQEFARQLASQQRKFVERIKVLDAYLDKMDKEYEEEIALAMRNPSWYLHNDCHADNMRKGLEAGIVHGRKGTDINSIPSYNLNAAKIQALLLMGVDDAKEDEVGTLANPAFGSTSFAGDGADQFIIALSVPYASDPGVLTKESATTEEVKAVESDANVSTRTVLDLAATVVPSTFTPANPFLFE